MIAATTGGGSRLDLEIGGRWHHPVHVFHGRERPKGAPSVEPSHAGRMSAELGIARALSGVVATAWLAIVAHQLTVYQFGQVTLVLSLGSLVSIGTDLGIPLALSKVACDHKDIDHDAVWRAIVTRLLAGLVSGLVLVVLWINTGEVDRWWVAALYSIAVIATPLGGSFLAMLRGRAIGIVEAVSELASQVALLAVGVVTLALGWKPSAVIACFVLVDVVTSLVLPTIAGRRLTLSKEPDPLQKAQLRLRATLPLAAAGILGTAYERIDVWLVALLKGSSSVAVYVASYKLYDTVLLPATAIAASAVAAAGATLMTNPRPIARRLAIRGAVVALPIAIVVALISPLLLRAAFGGHYGSNAARDAVAILMVAALPGAALAAITPIALLCQRTVIVKWTIAGLVGNIVANVILVPAIGIEGAALAFLITDSILLVAFYRSLPGEQVVAPSAPSAPTTAKPPS